MANNNCGCTLLEPGGAPATWADKGLVLAQTEIQERGWDANRERLENDLCLTNHFKEGSPTFQDDEISRTFTMDMLNPFIKAPLFQETHGTSTQQFAPDRCFSSNEIAAIISQDSHTGCDPRGVSMLASGSEEFRGQTQYIVITEPVQCILNYRGKLKNQFGQYLKALVRAMPRAAMRIKEWNMFNTLQLNGYNVSETGDKGLRFEVGQLPSIPDAVFGPSTLRLFERHLRNNDFLGKKVWHIDERVFRSMMLFRRLNGASGFAVQSTSFMGPDMPDYAVGATKEIDGVWYRICDLPFGYIKQTGPNTRQFIPIDPRIWKAVNQGVRAFGDSRYDAPTFTDDNGAVHNLVSFAWAADPDAYLVRPIGIDAKTPVTAGSEGWAATSEVKFIGDADLGPCNVDRQFFQPRFKQGWKMAPQQPRAAGVAWSRLPGEERIANRIGLDSYELVPLQAVTVNPGCEVTGLTCLEKQACAADAAPLPSVVGVLKTECRLELKPGAAALLKVTVLRTVPVGHSAAGAVTLNWATAAGTATAGVAYTTESGVLSWADTECGYKTFDVAILAGALPETQFNINYSGVTPSGSAAALLPATTCLTTVVAFQALPEAD